MNNNSGVKDSQYNKKNESIKYKSFIIAANWKMNKTMEEVCSFIERLNSFEWNIKNKVILFPSFPYLIFLKQLLKGKKALCGAQNMHWEDSGAYTGEVAPAMLKDLGCRYCIVGHSERRNILLETDNMINKKILSAIKNDIVPILCIGESIKERKNNTYKSTIMRQLKEDLSGLSPEKAEKLIIAYEPLWAIGTGLNANAEQVYEMHQYIKWVLIELFGNIASSKVPILYGGSVKSSNVKDLAIIENVYGFLIGGASLKIEDFLSIIKLLE